MITKVRERKGRGNIRRQQICNLLMERGYADVGDLSMQLNANVATVRRDLIKLEAEGAVERVHGGAYARAAQTGVLVDFSLRTKFQSEAKRAIARKVASLIENGDTVYLDTGTTAAMVAEELVERQPLVVVTNSLAVAQILLMSRGINLYVVGGRYLPHTRALIGPMTEREIEGFRFRKTILATAGIDYKNRVITNAAFEEVPLKRAAMRQSDQVILAADSSKFGKPSLISMIPLSDIHILVTDMDPPPEAAAILRSLGIEVLIGGTSPKETH
jgi:DeoR/GlpR family transcriptional regulator of sugar metabolism